MKRTPLARKTPLRAKKSLNSRTTALRSKNPAERKNGAKKTGVAKKREMKKKLCEQYDLPIILCSRWGTAKAPTRQDLLKGMLWHVFAKYVRERDKELPCISCGKHHEAKQAGHYAPVGGGTLDLNFDEKNVNGECPNCNGFDPFHLVPMRKNLIAKYGEATVEDLDARKSTMLAVKWDEQDFVDRIKKYL